MEEPVWLDRTALLLLHEESLADFGGGSGLRDEGLLDSALARPLQLLAYGTPDLADLAASYAFGVAKNHPFVDGNKRTAFMALVLFLDLNGIQLKASAADATVVMLGLAAGERSENDLAKWVRANADLEAREKVTAMKVVKKATKRSAQKKVQSTAKRAPKAGTQRTR